MMKNQGQVVVEFTFCMVIVLLMMYAAIKIFSWSGKDWVGRRQAHDNLLFDNSVVEDYSAMPQGPLKQIDSYFYGSAKMNTILKP